MPGPRSAARNQRRKYLGRHTHRVAISNHRLLSLEDGQVTFQWKDYLSEHRERSKTMTIDADAFQRRFLIHTLPAGFQRIRHYGFLANCHPRDKLEYCRSLLMANVAELLPQPAECAQMKEAIKIEHRLFSFITLNWRGKPLRSFKTIVQLIAATTSSTGLTVHAELDENKYPKGVRISDARLAAVNLNRHTFHGDWNYTISPDPN
jgi:hypothetical protein